MFIIHKLCELLQSAIPYPLIILLKHNEQYCFNTADKRINQVEKEKRVVSFFTLLNSLMKNAMVLKSFSQA